jgi:hypothetical protein
LQTWQALHSGAEGIAVTAYLQELLNFIGLHPNLAIAAAFIVSAGEALPIVGLFSQSTLVLIGIGGFCGPWLLASIWAMRNSAENVSRRTSASSTARSARVKFRTSSGRLFARRKGR